METCFWYGAVHSYIHGMSYTIERNAKINVRKMCLMYLPRVQKFAVSSSMLAFYAMYSLISAT